MPYVNTAVDIMLSVFMSIRYLQYLEPLLVMHSYCIKASMTM